MIKIENEMVVGFEPAIRGMRNPLNSWEKSDSYYCMSKQADCATCKLLHSDRCGKEMNPYIVGDYDLKLMKTLSSSGDDHGKFMRMLVVYVDIVAPLYWWKEFDTYKIGTVANSCSTMHKIHAKEFDFDDFSHEHLLADDGIDNILFGDNSVTLGLFDSIIQKLNINRELYLKTKNKTYWWQMIQMLPSSYNQRRTVMLNYAVLKNIYHARKDHKLDEWHTFCDWIMTLPYAEELIK